MRLQAVCNAADYSRAHTQRQLVEEKKNSARLQILLIGVIRVIRVIIAVETLRLASAPSDVAVQIQGAKEQFFQTVLLSLGARGQQPDRCFFLVAAAVAAQLARESAAALPKSFPTMSCVLLC